MWFRLDLIGLSVMLSGCLESSLMFFVCLFKVYCSFFTLPIQYGLDEFTREGQFLYLLTMYFLLAV